MNNPLDFYLNRKGVFEKELIQIKKHLVLSSVLRLFVFFSVVFSTYFFFGNTKLIVSILFFGSVFFLFLVTKHSVLQQKRDKIVALIQINTTEIIVLKGDFTSLNTGKEFKNAQHAYSYDIDLFGVGSFFQYINRTVIRSGKEALAAILTANKIDSIEKKQQVIKELASKPKWRQNFSATASLVQIETKTSSIVNWVQNHQKSLPQIASVLPTFFFSVSIVLFVLKYLDFIGFNYIITWFFIGLGITSFYLKKITNIYQKANHAKSTFRQYYQLLIQIENEIFTSDILLKKQQEIQLEGKKASAICNDFFKILDALDQRNNILFAMLGNAFALWDIRQSYKVERWIETYQNQVKKWFAIIAFFDAQNSLGNYAFNHPKHSFPKLEENDFTIKAKELGHPLLHEKKRVNNDLSIHNQAFFIVTGANMAGKSTFLRTVSLSIVMANIGLPVCAEKFSYSPIRLITSMRTADSLVEDSSYFFSELKRLKFIVDAINPITSQKKYFIVLDEILKGTNSKDKAIGSRKFVEKLVASNSTGIIATHDLSLCEITKELPQVTNYYFDAEINNNELYFDYTFKNGVCQNMNASFLLKKMEIV